MYIKRLDAGTLILLFVLHDTTYISYEEFEDTKMVVDNSKTNRQYNGQKKKDRQYNGQKKKNKGQTTIYKTLHIKLKIE